MPKLENGLKALVSSLADSPLEGIEQSVSIEVQTAPNPADLTPGEALIAIRSAGLSWVDLLMTSGQYQHMPTLPYTPGMEFAGDVIAVGADSDAIWLNQPVFVDCFSVGPRSSGAYQHAGGFASYAVVPVSVIRKIPTDWTYDQACNFAGNYETAYHCLVTRGQLKADESLLILGASGATGVAAIQVAKSLGARVLATTRTAHKVEQLKQLGADHVICTQGESDGDVRRFRDDVKLLTDNRGVDCVYDGVGGPTSLEAIRCTRFGARFLIVGWASTPDVARGRGRRGAPNANRIPTNLILMKSLDVLGCPAVISTKHDPSLRATRQDDLLLWAEQGRIKPYISHRFQLQNLKEALLAKWTGDIIGGCAILAPDLPLRQT
ncbi:MAG: hypothetical protein CMH52_01285 [Myxococcales bacterium]|nr:hypothetical protein [Myxococcales bacterium]